MSSALAPTELRGFILTRHWRDLPDGTEIECWLATEEGPKKVLLTQETSVAFLPACHRAAAQAQLANLQGLEVRELGLKTFEQEPVLGVYARRFRDLGKLARTLQPLGIPLYEADVRPHDRYLFAPMPGRVVVDGIEALRAGMWSFPTFSLEAVSQALLGEGKEIGDAYDKMAEIERRYQEDKPALASYNIRDCALVLRIFDKLELLPFVLERAQTTGLQIDHFGGSIAAFSHHYLPRMHRLGYVAPNLGDIAAKAFPGGYVMDSTPGYRAFVADYARSMLDGQMNELLVYRKRLRHRLDAYEVNVPPQVRAARIADAHNAKLNRPQQYQRGGWIQYVMTQSGPEPLEARHSRIDYEHYLVKQLQPIADAILQPLGDSFAALTSAQKVLF